MATGAAAPVVLGGEVVTLARLALDVSVELSVDDGEADEDGGAVVLDVGAVDVSPTADVASGLA